MSLQVPESGCWGAHLNRQPKTPRLSHRSCAVPKASAQYYGMKLKSNLGAAGKVRAGWELALTAAAQREASTEAACDLFFSPPLATPKLRPPPARAPQNHSLLLPEPPTVSREWELGVQNTHKCR